MNLRQFRAFLKLAWARYIDSQITLAVNARQAHNAEGDGFKKYLEDLAASKD